MALYGYGVEPIQDPIAVGGSSAPTGYNLIEQNGTPLTQRTTLNVLPRLLAQDDGVSATTLDLAQVGTAGTYTSVTTDAYGRVTAGTNPGFLTSHTLQQSYNDGSGGTAGSILLTAAKGPLIVQSPNGGMTAPLAQFLGDTGENLFLVAGDASTFGLGGAAVYTTTLLPLAGGSTPIGSSSSPFGSYNGVDATLTKNLIGTAQTFGLAVHNTSAAANNAQQFSPTFGISGRGWNQTAGGSSVTVRWDLQTRPVQNGANDPTNDLVFWSTSGATSNYEAARLTHVTAGSNEVKFWLGAGNGAWMRTTQADLELGYSTNTAAVVSQQGWNFQLGVGWNRTAVVDTNFTLSSQASSLIAYTSISAARTVTAVAGMQGGRFIVIKDESGSASGVNTISFATVGGGTIDGAASPQVVVNSARGVKRLYTSDGTNWFSW